MRTLVPIAAALAILVGGATATREEPGLTPTALAYRQLAEKDIRLATIGYNLARASAPFCELKSANPGWVLHDIAQYGDTAAAREAFVFREDIAIMAVVEGGPAARIGISGGDGLITYAGNSPDKAIGKKPSANRMEIVRAGVAKVLETGGKIEIRGAKDRKTFYLRPEGICKSDFWVDTRSKRDAGADGDRVRVTSGMIDYVLDDDELAAVVAHEMAHNILGHRARIDAAKYGKTKIIRATEEEADRLSVWLMANAGYDLEAAITFWQRYGRATSLGIFNAPTHYRWQDRVAMLQQEIEAIRTTPTIDNRRDPPLLTAQRAMR
ncbi:MAG: M48 family metalloprotease [Sphingorhabdus sp.]